MNLRPEQLLPKLLRALVSGARSLFLHTHNERENKTMTTTHNKPKLSTGSIFEPLTYPLTHQTGCSPADKLCVCGFVERAYEAIRDIDGDIERLKPFAARTPNNKRWGGEMSWRAREQTRALEERRFELTRDLLELGVTFVEPTYEFRFDVSETTRHGQTQLFAIPVHEFNCRHTVEAHDEHEAQKLAIRDHIENCKGGAR